MSQVILVHFPDYAGMPFLHFAGCYPGQKPSSVGIIKESELWSTQEVSPLSSLQGDKVKM